MKQMIQLTIMVSFLVNGMAGINVADSPNLIDGQIWILLFTRFSKPPSQRRPPEIPFS